MRPGCSKKQLVANHQLDDGRGILRMTRNFARRENTAYADRYGTVGAAAILSMTTVLCAGVAHAQGEPLTEASEQQVGHGLEEVLVTARRREESAQSVP